MLNRFSKDMGSIDELLPRSMLETIQMYLTMTSILVLNAIALPWTLIPTAVLMFLFIFLLKWYLNAAQAVKRLEGTSKNLFQFIFIFNVSISFSLIYCF